MDPTLEEVVTTYTTYDNIGIILKLIFQNMLVADEQGRNIYEAYLYVNPYASSAGSCLIKQPTRLYLTKQIIQILLIKINHFVIRKLQLEIFHPLATKKDAHDLAFLQLEELELRNKPEPSFYISIAPHSSDWPSRRFPEGYHDPDNFTETHLSITPRDIYIRADGQTMKSIKESVTSPGLDHLNSEQVKTLKGLMAVASMDRINNLILMLDPQWEHYSEEFHIVIDLIEAALIRNEGNKSATYRNRMIAKLHNDYAELCPKPEKGKAINATTNRLATVANPKNSK